MTRSFDLFAACLPGLEPFLTRELQALGTEPQAMRGGVAFRGDARCAARACLWLGTASHVLIRVAEFPCRALGELQRKAALLPWREWLRAQVPVEVHATSRASRVYHTGAIAERIENAIGEALGSSVRAPAAGDEVFARIHVRFANDVCTISVDATTSPLHRRGWRLAGAKAPLREDLAHALLLASQWTPDTALLDPFCGSGTIAIEAAGLALGLPPGRLRPPPLHHLALFDAETWLELRSAPTTPRGAGIIAASDRDAGAVEAARANAERAGVKARIGLSVNAFTQTPWLDDRGDAAAVPQRGVLATNPPFGLRVGKGEGLGVLWQSLGHRARRLGPDWSFALLAHDVRLARRCGMALRAAWTTRHGGLSVTALVGDADAAVSTPAAG